MAYSTNVTCLTMRSFLEQDKLTETNYLDWEDNLRLFLKQQGKLYVLDAPVPNKPLYNATAADKAAYEKHAKDSYDVGCLMLAAMSPHFQKIFERVDAYQIHVILQKVFQQFARQERYVTASAFFSCKMAEGDSASSHVLKMKGYIDRLDRLGYPLGQELATDFILNSLSNAYDQFVKNYVKQSMDKPISELHLMLAAAEMNMNPKPNHALMVRSGQVTKKTGKGKQIAGKSNTKKPYADAICHHCNETGHWKRNCKLYLEELKKNKASEAHTLAM